MGALYPRSVTTPVGRRPLGAVLVPKGDCALGLPDRGPVYQGADIIPVPTVLEEGFGFTAVEGMACGKPVIWFDQPAIREATGGIGLPVPREDIDALRAAIMRLMDDPAERARIGAEGRARCETALSWDAAWGRYEAALRGIARS